MILGVKELTCILKKGYHVTLMELKPSLLKVPKRDDLLHNEPCWCTKLLLLMGW